MLVLNSQYFCCTTYYWKLILICNRIHELHFTTLCSEWSVIQYYGRETIKIYKQIITSFTTIWGTWIVSQLLTWISALGNSAQTISAELLDALLNPSKSSSIEKTSCEVAHEHWGIQHNALWYFHKSFFFFAQSASMKSFLIMCDPSSVPGCWPFSTHKCPFGIKNATGMVLLNISKPDKLG